jgi:hypothetical protein
MDRPSSLLADRYHLSLSSQWKDWFDVHVKELELPGCFRFPVSADELCQDSPTFFWPGFMQPDAIPLIGNAYGDWICARITENNQFGELIHWYHGGGDWIPVGSCLAEAILHDAIDQYRPVQKQMLRGAAESIRQDSPGSIRREVDGREQLCHWIVGSIPGFGIESSLSRLLATTGSENYQESLRFLMNKNVSMEACCCDTIESIITQTLPDDRSSIGGLPPSEWKRISELCSQILQRRTDIGWSFALQGLSHFYLSGLDKARETWFAGRFASAFSDQSVRLRLHHLETGYRKSNIALLANHADELPEMMRNDPYLEYFLNLKADSITETIQNYWYHRGLEALAQERFGEAYDCFFRSGWDLGAGQISQYKRILRNLLEAAQGAGWHARARLIETFIACMSR